MVSLRYHNEGFIDKFDRQIKALNEVQECYHMAGKVDFFLKINLQSLDAYHEFIRLKLSKIENIGVLESYFVLKEIFFLLETSALSKASNKIALISIANLFLLCNKSDLKYSVIISNHFNFPLEEKLSRYFLVTSCLTLILDFILIHLTLYL